jgi:hypothetical protein
VPDPRGPPHPDPVLSEGPVQPDRHPVWERVLRPYSTGPHAGSLVRSRGHVHNILLHQEKDCCSLKKR